MARHPLSVAKSEQRVRDVRGPSGGVASGIKFSNWLPSVSAGPEGRHKRVPELPGDWPAFWNAFPDPGLMGASITISMVEPSVARARV